MAGSGRPITTWGMLRTPGTTGHHIVRLPAGVQDDSDSDIDHNKSTDDELPLTTSEEPSVRLGVFLSMRTSIAHKTTIDFESIRHSEDGDRGFS